MTAHVEMTWAVIVGSSVVLGCWLLATLPPRDLLSKCILFELYATILYLLCLIGYVKLRRFIFGVVWRFRPNSVKLDLQLVANRLLLCYLRIKLRWVIFHNNLSGRKQPNEPKLRHR